MNTEASDRADSEMNIKTLEEVLKQLIKKKYKKNEIVQNIMIAKLKKL